MDKRRKSLWLNIIYTLVMSLCITVIMIVTYHQISDLAEQACFQKLRVQTSTMRDELKKNVDSDTRLLKTIGGNLAELSDLEGKDAQKVLSFEKAGSLLEQVELLLPDGRVLVSEDRVGEADGMSNVLLDYKTEASSGEHITGRLRTAEDSQEWYAYHIMPVLRGEETVALLCGRISLTKLQEEYRGVLKANGSRFHLVEAKEKEALIDTTHGTLGKVDLSSKISKRGDSIETVVADMEAGIPGEVTFYSNTIQEDLYSVYEPVGIQDWFVILSMPESIAFASVKKINLCFAVSVVIGAIVLIIYFLALLSRGRKIADELETQYSISQRLRKIQELLFHSVLRPEQMTMALWQLGKLLTAEKVYLISEPRKAESQIFCSIQPKTKEVLSKTDFQVFMQWLKSQGKVYFSELEELVIPEEDRELLRLAGVRNGMGIVLRDSDSQYSGVLFAVNMVKEWHGVEPLEDMRFVFSMVLDNIEAFGRIKELGSRDQLTGLLNRNSYQKIMELYERVEGESLDCIYIDVDGLHELNNRLGHTEGDRMLISISLFLQQIFGENAAYRIGGDEFLVFSQGIEETELKRNVLELEKRVEDSGYHISLGIAARREAPLVYEMVRLAESRMYEAKREYYRNRKNGEKVREMNHQLEATLLEKRDLNAFCSVLAYRYVGVYIVNLSVDTIRAINIPQYFEEKLEQAGGKFSRAVQLYIQDMVVKEYHEEFQPFLDYEKLYKRLKLGEEPRYIYNKLDGSCILLKVYPAPNFDEFQKECIWTFEVMEKEKQ